MSENGHATYEELFEQQLALHAASVAARVQSFGRWGLHYTGQRDLIKVLGYLASPSFEDYQAYAERGLGARLVEIVPQDTWAEAPTVVEDEDPDVETDFEADWNALTKRVDVFGALADLDILAQYGEYAGLLVAIEGVENFDAPLDGQANANGPEGLLYLQPYSQGDLIVNDLDRDRYSARYGLPTRYQVVHNRDNKAADHVDRGARLSGSFYVHHSHIIHFADHARGARTYGQPWLKRGLDQVFNLDKMIGGLGEMTWRDGKRRVAAEIREGFKFRSQGDANKQREQLHLFTHDLADFIRVDGTDIKSLDGTVPNLDGNLLRLFQLIAGIFNLPMRKIFGSEQGQLATTADMKEHYKRIRGRLERLCIPQMIRPLIDLLIDTGVLRAPAEEYKVEPPEVELSGPERAEIDRAYVQNVTDYVGPMGEPETVLSVEEFRTLGLSQWGLPAETPGLPVEDDDVSDDE